MAVCNKTQLVDDKNLVTSLSIGWLTNL